MLSLDRAENVLTLVAVLSTLEPGTRDHSEQVAELAARLARQLKLPPEDREQLRWAALVHDIGKLTVPPEILNKPGPLTPDEWSVIYMHPFFGDRILRPLHGWLGPAARAVLEHHERWDGSGYPNGLREGQISLAGRIVAVADSFEVMRSTRVYKRSMSLQAARRELLHHAGSQFDPAVVAACLAITAGWTEVPANPRTALSRVPVLAGLLAALSTLRHQSAVVALASVTVVGGAVWGPLMVTGAERPPAHGTVVGAVLGATDTAPAAPAPAPSVDAPTGAQPPPAVSKPTSAPGVAAPASPEGWVAAAPLTLTLGPDQVITEGGTVSTSGSIAGGAGGWTATIDYGDGGGAQPLFLNGQYFRISHAYRDVGLYQLSVLVRDARQQTAAGRMGVSVTNYATAVHLPADTSCSLSSGGLFSVAGTFDDPGNDTWTGTVSYGDGTGQRPLALSGHSFNLSHTFTTKGTYTVTVRITDSDGYTGVGYMRVQVVD